MAVQGADGRGLVELAAALGAARADLGDRREAVCGALAVAGRTSPVPAGLSSVESWCADQQVDVVERAALMALARGGPAGVLLAFGAAGWASLLGTGDRTDRPESDLLPEWLADRVEDATGPLPKMLVRALRDPELLGRIARVVRVADGFHRALGPLGFAADVHGVFHPPHDGARGVADRVASGAGAVGFASVFIVPAAFPPAGLLSVPVGAILMGTSGLYALGSFAYDHRQALGRAAIAGAEGVRDRVEDLARLAAGVGTALDAESRRTADWLDEAGLWAADAADDIADAFEPPVDVDRFQIAPLPVSPDIIRRGGAAVAGLLHESTDLVEGVGDAFGRGGRWLEDQVEDQSVAKRGFGWVYERVPW